MQVGPLTAMLGVAAGPVDPTFSGNVIITAQDDFGPGFLSGYGYSAAFGAGSVDSNNTGLDVLAIYSQNETGPPFLVTITFQSATQYGQDAFTSVAISGTGPTLVAAAADSFLAEENTPGLWDMTWTWQDAWAGFTAADSPWNLNFT